MSGHDPQAEQHLDRAIPGAANDEARLVPADAEALDALIDAGYDAGAVPAACADRARRIAALFGLAAQRSDPAGSRARPDLSSRVMAAIPARQRQAGASTPRDTEYTLGKDDAAALADLGDAAYDERGIPAKSLARARAISAMRDLIVNSGGRSFADPGLARRTFDLVMVQADSDARTFHIREAERAAAPASWRSRFWNGVAVAAMLMFGVSVIVPMVDYARQQQQRTACGSNFGSIASAMAAYAGAHRESLPVATAGFGGSWIDVGKPDRSNSANLYTLARTGYTPLRTLACPGNADACRNSDCPPGAMDWQNIREVSYSYQIMFGPVRPVWNSPARSALLADRSPVILRAIRGETAYANENSPNHRARGQDVLFADGSFRWFTTPELTPDGDNIWLPYLVERALRRDPIVLQGIEMPGSDQDAFLAP